MCAFRGTGHLKSEETDVSLCSQGFVIFIENTPFSFLFSFSVGKFSGRKFSGSPSSTASIVVLLVQPAPEEEDLTKEGEGEQRWLLHVLYTVLSLRK